MRLPRLRFTIRRMLMLVAVIGMVAAPLTIRERRRLRFEALSEVHLAKMIQLNGNRPLFIRKLDDLSPLQVYHARLSAKYHRAASRPMVSVEPDPPEPR
jgi:hypothetical protein